MLVRAELAGVVLRALVRHVTELARVDGATVSPACRALLTELYEASRRPCVAGSGNDDAAPATVDEVTGSLATVAQVAAETGHSERTLRYWAARGEITARRAGRAWLIDPTSLRKSA